MYVDEIRERIRRQPFEPFRLHVSDGSRYDVLHHDFALVFMRSVTIAVGAPTADDYPAKSVDIDPLHITRIESLAPSPNGRKKRRTRK